MPQDAARQDRFRYTQGFTLAELAVVISILTVILAVGFIAMSRARANRELDGSAAELTAALKMARQSAIALGGCTLTFTGSPVSTWAVTRPDGATLAKGTFPTSMTASVPTGMLTLTFAANGAASAGGTITLTSSTGRRAQLVVNQDAGTVVLTLI